MHNFDINIAMKLALLFLLSFIGLGELHAQQYQCLQPGRKQYFTNSIHYLRGMRIDSSFSDGSTTVFYPFRSPRFIGKTNNIDSNGGSWLGKTVVQLADGTTLFDNIWNDTVMIRTRAGTGESWVFYNDATTTYYNATVTKIDTERVFGHIDSVKTIRITAMKGSSVETANPVNGYTFAISKDHGFVRIFDLYTFPYTVGTSHANDYFLTYGNGPRYQFSLIDYQNPRNFDLYDFAVGDVFLMTGILLNPSLSIKLVNTSLRDTIVGKTVSSSDISYTIKGLSKSVALDENGREISGYGPFIHVKTIIPNDTLELLDKLRMPEETGNWFRNYYNPADTSRCTTSAMYARHHFYLVYPLDAPTNTKVTYKAGFGLIDSIGGYMWGTQGAQATYYWNIASSIKNGIVCGNFPVSVQGSVIDDELFHVYPNPAGSTVHIRYDGPVAAGVEVSIIDLSGRQVYHHRGSSGSLSIPTSELPAGIYLLRMRSDGVVSNQKLSIIH